MAALLIVVGISIGLIGVLAWTVDLLDFADAGMVAAVGIGLTIVGVRAYLGRIAWRAPEDAARGGAAFSAGDIAKGAVAVVTLVAVAVLTLAKLTDGPSTPAEVCASYDELDTRIAAANGIIDNPVFTQAGKLADVAGRYHGEPRLNEDAAALRRIADSTQTTGQELAGATRHIATLCRHPLAGDGTTSQPRPTTGDPAERLLGAVTDLGRQVAAEGTVQTTVDLAAQRTRLPHVALSSPMDLVVVGTVAASVDLGAVPASAVVVSGDQVIVTVAAPRLEKPNLDLSKSYLVSRDSNRRMPIADAFGTDPQALQELYALAETELATKVLTGDLPAQAEQNIRTLLETTLRETGYAKIEVRFTR